MEVLQQVQLHWILGLHEGVLALVEGLLRVSLVPVGGQAHHSSPESIVLTVGVAKEYAVSSYQMSNIAYLKCRGTCKQQSHLRSF